MVILAIFSCNLTGEAETGLISIYVCISVGNAHGHARDLNFGRLTVLGLK